MKQKEEIQQISRMVNKYYYILYEILDKKTLIKNLLKFSKLHYNR